MRKQIGKVLALSFGLFLLGVIPHHLIAQTHIILQVNQPAALQVDAGQDTLICIDDSLSVLLGGSPTASQGTPPYQYEWTPVTWLSDPTAANPVATPLYTETYTLKVTDQMNCTQSDTVVVIVSPCPGIDEKTRDFSMHIFPNPTSGKITITLDNNHDLTDPVIEVINIFGQVIYTERFSGLPAKSEIPIDISHNAKGIYFIRLQEKSNIIVKTVLVD